MKTKKANNYLMIAAILMTVTSLYSLYKLLYPFIRSIISNGAEWTINFYLHWIGLLPLATRIVWYIAMPIALFIKNKRFIALISGLQILDPIHYIVKYIVYANADVYYYVDAILSLLTYISLSVLLFSAYKERKIVSKIWYLPSLCYVMHLVVYNIVIYRLYQSFTLLTNAIEIVIILSLFFLGLWVKNDLSLLAHTVKGGADELIAYKNMLDSGEITQEEFEAKKKEIIG